MKQRLVWHYPHLKFWMGGTKFIYETAKELLPDFNITLVVNGGDPAVIKKFESIGIKVISTSPLTSNSLVYWLLFPFILTYDLFASLKQFRQAEHRLATLFPSNLIFALASKLTGKPFYYYCYEPFPFLQNQAFINTFPPPNRWLLKILSLLYRWTDTWATKKAQAVFTLNQVTRKTINKTYGLDSIVTLMGVNSDHFKPTLKPNIAPEFHRKTFITHSTDYTAMKRTDLAIKAMKLVIKKHPQALLLITSTQPDSPEQVHYRGLATNLGLEKNINFLGLIPYDDLPGYYSASVCYLSCSVDQMLGTTSSNMPVKEALACGTPAIRANITTEDVEDGVSGFLVDPRNTRQVAEKINYLIEHPGKAREMGEAGRKKIVKLYRWDHVAQVILNTLNRKENHDQVD